jgi:hypothetical protein
MAGLDRPGPGSDGINMQKKVDNCVPASVKQLEATGDMMRPTEEENEGDAI